MRKVAIYGAGNNLNLLITSDCINCRDKLVLIIDRNEEKWGRELFGCKIMGLNSVPSFDIDYLIISITEYDEVIYDVREYFDDDSILIFDHEKKEIVPFYKVRRQWLSRQIVKKRVVEQIQIGLLEEADRWGEFDNVDTAVVSNPEYIDLLRQYFFLLNPDIVVRKWMDIFSDGQFMQMQGVIYILCDKEYKEKIKILKEKCIDDNNWIVLPLYDVEKKVKLRRDT